MLARRASLRGRRTLGTGLTVIFSLQRFARSSRAPQPQFAFFGGVSCGPFLLTAPAVFFPRMCPTEILRTLSGVDTGIGSHLFPGPATGLRLRLGLSLFGIRCLPLALATADSLCSFRTCNSTFRGTFGNLATLRSQGQACCFTWGPGGKPFGPPFGIDFATRVPCGTKDSGSPGGLRGFLRCVTLGVGCVRAIIPSRSVYFSLC